MIEAGADSAVGVSGWASELVGLVDAFEIDALDPLLESARERRRLASLAARGQAQILISASSFFFRPGEEPAEQEEKRSLLRELCASTNAVACSLKLPPGFCRQEGTAARLHEFIRGWRRDGEGVSLWVDPGKSGYDPADTILTAEDPLWGNPKRSDYWRIHGWHASRWVRLYGREELERIVLLSRKLRPRWIIFTHSQRRLQAPAFRERLRNAARARPQGE